jgi:hypothetical protein
VVSERGVEMLRGLLTDPQQMAVAQPLYIISRAIAMVVAISLRVGERATPLPFSEPFG